MPTKKAKVWSSQNKVSKPKKNAKLDKMKMVIMTPVKKSGKKCSAKK